MKNFFIRTGLILYLLCTVSFAVRSEVNGGNFAVGLNYPGIGLKYFLTDKIPLELKIQTDTNVTVTGLRGYYYFNPSPCLHLYAGLEMDTLSFTGEVSKGSGFATLLFIGGEYFLGNSLSLQLDIGPAMISLSDTDTSVSVSGMEFVANLGINYYFGR